MPACYAVRVTFLLVSGASGAGKSSVRAVVAPALAPRVRCVELRDLVEIPAFPDIAWRQRTTECAVRQALELQAQGRHLMLAGDPVAPGELLAAPSADRLEATAICVLDCAPDVQRARLTARGDDPALLPNHVAFADWMRRHAADPGWMPHVLTTGGWPEMRWDRWSGWRRGDARWRIDVIDTTALAVPAVAGRVLAWAERALSR
jgi:hypothetical protein